MQSGENGLSLLNKGKRGLARALFGRMGITIFLLLLNLLPFVGPILPLM